MKSFFCTVFMCAAVVLLSCDAQANSKKVDKIIGNNDADGDGRIAESEWPKSKKAFKKMDADGDGYLTKEELTTFFSQGGPTVQPSGSSTKSASAKGLVNIFEIDKGTKIAFKAHADEPVSVERGLLESTLEPQYPTEYYCPKVDHVFGEYWRGPTPNRLHTGADIPANWDEPIYAMADGEVVAKFKGEKGNRGLQVVLRHTPEQTGLGVYLYTLYSHFNKMPEVEIGQLVKKGDYLGPNGKTGVPGKKRGPHLHLSIYASLTPEYAVTKGLLMPMNAQFIDVVSLFRGKMPIFTNDVAKLPADQKKVSIAFKDETGQIHPKGSKIIWPYACRKN